NPSARTRAPSGKVTIATARGYWPANALNRCVHLRCGHESPEEADVLVARTRRPGDAGPRGRGATPACGSRNDQDLAGHDGEGDFRLPPFSSHTRRAASGKRGDPRGPLTLRSRSAVGA